ncbi:hypothetical protein C5Y97_02640 [Blastopirellula marina]|uniref:Uncharacterized protein n=1 Tax=Blastopirellula marina TaxID=124 RepID=A0A2S8GCC3_9BACT|nr:hypothetical protein C5Y98_02640 [Blastopirellula marina]PTL46307.1 hypothetical protein C5Y97_02640 [Blastopirellula marina]
MVHHKGHARIATMSMTDTVRDGTKRLFLQRWMLLASVAPVKTNSCFPASLRDEPVLATHTQKQTTSWLAL